MFDRLVAILIGFALGMAFAAAAAHGAEIGWAPGAHYIRSETCPEFPTGPARPGDNCPKLFTWYVMPDGSLGISDRVDEYENPIIPRVGVVVRRTLNLVPNVPWTREGQ